MFIAQEKNPIENIMNFTHVEFGEVRAVALNAQPWFVGKDVAAALGYKDTFAAIKLHVDEEDRQNWQNASFESPRGLTIINESGLYSLIFGSKLPTAVKFKKWVTDKVLPSIRRFGCYIDGNHKNIRELSKCTHNALKSGIDVLIRYGSSKYDIDEENVHRTISSKANVLAGIDHGKRDIADTPQLIRLICIQSAYLQTIVEGIIKDKDFCDIVNKCDDNAKKELKRFSFEIILLTSALNEDSDD